MSKIQLCRDGGYNQSGIITAQNLLSISLDPYNYPQPVEKISEADRHPEVSSMNSIINFVYNFLFDKGMFHRCVGSIDLQ